MQVAASLKAARPQPLLMLHNLQGLQSCLRPIPIRLQ